MKKSMIVAMNPFTTIHSQRNHQPMTGLPSLLILFLIFSPTLVSSSTSSLSYSDHCSSIVPYSTPTTRDNSIYPLLQTRITHYTGGQRILANSSSESNSSPNSQKYVSLYPFHDFFKTNTSGVYKIQARLLFPYVNEYNYFPTNTTYGRSNYKPPHRTYSLLFTLDGFWSKDSGKSCMVGSAFWHSKEGKLVNLDAVFKFSFQVDSNISTCLVTGKLESLSPPNDTKYFEPISILGFSSANSYNYSLVSNETKGSCSSEIDIPKNKSLGLQPRIGFCSMLRMRMNTFQLEYTNGCISSLQNCSLFGYDIDYLPRLMVLNSIQCSGDEKKVQYLVGFGNHSRDINIGYSRHFDPTITLVAEGSWDGNKNRLCIVACRILNSTNENAHVGDCSIRVSLRYPALWSIRNRNSIVGEIWTNKTVNESGYFNKVMFGSTDYRMEGLEDLRYEYTENERVTKVCPMKKHVKRRKGEKYPKGNSHDMRFDMSVKDTKGKLAWGYAAPIFVGNQRYEWYQNVYFVPSSRHGNSTVEANASFGGPLNVSYTISITKLRDPLPGYGVSSTNLSFIRDGRMEISAEGVYDDETGYLCMVGCRKLVQDFKNPTIESMDCEIVLKFQFPPVNAKRGGTIKGRIESTRENTDPLYFEPLSLSSNAFYTAEAKKSIWRMDFEITMVLISNTLACVFVGLQLFYVKKNPDVLPFMSLVMLVILTLGHMIPLVLNFEAMFLGNRNRQNLLVGTGGWLEVNEVIVRVVTMVAFLLEFRLLQLVWSSHLGDETRKGLWNAEKKTLLVSLPLYLIGVLIALLMNLLRNNHNSHQHHSLLEGLRSYGGLVIDGFLFPQILLNMFRISCENALSLPFYLGTTFVRVLPHAYDLYRSHNFSRRRIRDSYIYANPNADLYSAAWDVVIPCGGVLFAVLIYFQQRFGGRCFLPMRFRETQVYEKVPIVSSE